ncbi:hypothetical protein H2198_003142 [Neophaeococcomyces mojaviensis]|uniref:Uncharacterized protein n=1 Tax=Neophaeococcomyces mojaviensis TaxID=3383035 RepID=A0ACC3AC75_9EURO|nr:hypothetical protein H2198_003142 [Knufia sp. JES_112]
MSPALTPVSGSLSAHTSTPDYPLTSYGPSSKSFDIAYSDLSLFDHYLRHTCHASGFSSGYAYARRIGLPMLASKSKGVLCSILAFGAACFCVDLLLGPDPTATVDQITHLIKTGDYYHGKALTTIQSLLGAKTPEELDIAHAHAAMLMGYAPARRRIFRLLQRQQPSPALVEQEPSADAPYNLDWAFLLRGVKSVAKARDACPFQEKSDDAPVGVLGSDLPDAVLSAYVAQSVELEREQVNRLSPCTKSDSMQTNAIKSVISSSVSKALDTLYDQINILELKLRSEQYNDIWSTSLAGIETRAPVLGSLVACYSAVTMLEATANGIFGTLPSTETRSPIRTRTQGEATGSLLKQWFSPRESHWLHDFGATQAEYRNSELVTRGVFTWIGHLPKEYFDVIITHYPERSSNVELTVEQQIHCLAWDIYAHWLVFTFLMEHELWWWADMGRSDIEKLRDTLPKSNENGYSVEVGIHNWWPWQMWSLAKELGIRKDEAGQGVES